jgi:hypothetical protein
MRLVTFKPDDGRVRLGAMLAGGGVLDLQQAAGGAAEFASMLALIEAGPGGGSGRGDWWQVLRERACMARRIAHCSLRCRFRRKSATSCVSRST